MHPRYTVVTQPVVYPSTFPSASDQFHTDLALAQGSCAGAPVPPLADEFFESTTFHENILRLSSMEQPTADVPIPIWRYFNYLFLFAHAADGVAASYKPQVVLQVRFRGAVQGSGSQPPDITLQGITFIDILRESREYLKALGWANEKVFVRHQLYT